ncbi:MAG: efflux RND transporter periplasmic adaptor subunit [Alphaproteobacteria bacterium]
MQTFKNIDSKQLLYAAVVLIILWFVAGALIPEGTDSTGNSEDDDLFTVEIVNSTARQHQAILTLRGHTEANRRVTMRAEVAGQVDKVLVEKGAVVEQGTPILSLNPRDKIQTLAEAKALVKQREIEYTAAKKLVSKAFKSQTKLAESEALLKKAEASLARIEADIEDTNIKAPFTGVVDSRYVEVGDYVKVADQVAMLVELHPLNIVAQVSEADVQFIRMGSVGKVRLASKNGLKATVTYIGSVAHPETRTFTVEFTLDNPEHRIRDGLTAEVDTPTAQVKAHMISPSILSLNDAGILGVKIVESGIVKFYPITVAEHSREGLWVSGLPEQIQLIINGQDYVIDGQKVNAVTFDG